MKQHLSRARTDRHIVVVVCFAFAMAGISCVRQERRSALMNPPPSLSAANTGTTSGPRLNINTASAAELEKLPGVGKILAERIVAYREQYGPFRRAEHLMMVQGCSDHKFRALRNLITAE